MALVIVLLMVVGCLLLATAHLTSVNKAAIAVFVGTIGWVLHMCCGGSDLVMQYVAKAAAIALFLLATMSIIEILSNNGCFDFITEWIYTRRSRELIWSLTFITFVISANLDNLTTTMMMLGIMHNIIRSRRQRMVLGSAIVLAANAGGCFTVIGDPAGVALWTNDAVTASTFSAYLALPAVAAWVVPTYLLGRDLPSRLDVEWPAIRYRGDETNLNRWQRFVMLVVGIGGLWFIPTFQNLTGLGPFLGAMCVLSVLWIVNEVMNRKLINTDMMIRRRMPRALQYDSIQLILFIIGIVLCTGVVKETGFFGHLANWVDTNIHDVWVTGIVAGLLGGMVDMFTVAMAGMSMWPVTETVTAGDAYAAAFACDGTMWRILAYTTAVGGSLFCYAGFSGLALMKMERIKVGWYFKNCTYKMAIGWLLGLAILWAETTFIG